MLPPRGCPGARREVAPPRAREADATYKITIQDRWHRAVFLALCRRYGITVHRPAGSRWQTMHLRVPPSFSTHVLWSEHVALTDFLRASASKIV